MMDMLSLIVGFQKEFEVTSQKLANGFNYHPRVTYSLVSKSREEDAAGFATTTWLIWHTRNIFKHEDIQLNEAIIALQAMTIIFKPFSMYEKSFK